MTLITRTASHLLAVELGLLALFFASGLSADECGQAGSAWRQSDRLEPLYTYDFSDPGQVNDWVAEGPANLHVRDGRLYLESIYRHAMTERMSSEEVVKANGTDERAYREDLLTLLAATQSKALDDHTPGKPIRFGHTVLWNRKPLPDSYVIEYTFRNESPYPLHLLHFSATGLKGEDIFSDALQPRQGIASEYMKGDISTYRVSYFSGSRESINLRVAPGRQLVDEVPDLTLGCAGREQHVRLVKEAGNIRMFFNNQLALELDDDEPLGGGYWGFRLMLFAASSYDNIRTYAIRAP